MVQLAIRGCRLLTTAARSLRVYGATQTRIIGRIPARPLPSSRRTFVSQREGGIDEVEDAYLPQGPKDTLLMLGYSVKEDQIEGHVQVLKETLKLKMMTLPYYSEDMAQSFTDLAMAQHQSVQFINEAKTNYLKALEIWTKICGQESREVANVLCLIGVVLRDIGDIDAANKQIGSVESQLSSVFALNNLAGIEHIKGNMAEATELYEEAARIMLTATGGDPNHRMIALLYYNIACSSAAMGDRVAAETALRRVRALPA
ncbi:hsp70 interacting protein, putative [Babesia ovata]|uniref:Hsp70 interacting protein, putative n=1 Tax=Babesia ovata TaxID=189622 RepID=A0A2H6KBV9_9APIC|nr:hsp70 interacting protein, putative [Babesia ovata]GBE60475.1 hsp70 interacting protein, putative [Babesia ovata]